MVFTLKAVNCLGACALGSMVVKDDDYPGHITQAKVDSLLNKYKSKV
jgi:NADH:ubiquinone oxidoreductase subunit E